MRCGSSERWKRCWRRNWKSTAKVKCSRHRRRLRNEPLSRQHSLMECGSFLLHSMPTLQLRDG